LSISTHRSRWGPVPTMQASLPKNSNSTSVIAQIFLRVEPPFPISRPFLSASQGCVVQPGPGESSLARALAPT